MTTEISLFDIMRMTTPFDVIGQRHFNVGNKIDSSVLKNLFDIFYGTGASAAYSSDKIAERLNSLFAKSSAQNVSPEIKNQLVKAIEFYSNSAVQVPDLSKASSVAVQGDGKAVNATFEQIIGTQLKTKKMAILKSNTPFISPQVRNAEKVELFLNSMPSVTTSRLTPILDVEFMFNSPFAADNENASFKPLGLMKFLLGPSKVGENDSTTKKLLELRGVQVGETYHTSAGMEMFTSPQTLVNPQPNLDGTRYNDVIDPMRPFMSIESFSMNVTPTVGLYSYKKGTLVLKLHDRSRLSDVAELLKPDLYQNTAFAPTIWITYGWSLPENLNDPYAQFINDNMLVREAYGIINTQFTFDVTGQVTLTLSLWTKGVSDLRTLKTSADADSPNSILNEMQKIADRLAKAKRKLGLDNSETLSKEFRTAILIDAVETRTFPDLSTTEIKASLEALKNSLLAKDAKINKAAAGELLEALKQYYKTADKQPNKLAFVEQQERAAAAATQKKFKQIFEGIDPFLPSYAKDKAAAPQGGIPSPISTLADALNAAEAETGSTAASPKGEKAQYKRKIVSFGKLVSVFFGSTLELVPGIDELQLFFYTLNDKAGLSALQNIVSFPIDVQAFLTQYAEYIEKKGSDSVTLEEFMQLVIDTQFGDPRGIGYGFRTYYEPFNPASPGPVVKKNMEQNLENAMTGISTGLGPFRQPQIEIYIETLYASAQQGTGATSLLAQFQSTVEQVTGAVDTMYKRIMRIHFYDKTNNPYKLAEIILKGEDGSFYSTDKENITAKTNEFLLKPEQNLDLFVGSVTSDGKINKTGSSLTSTEIKHALSRTLPTIVYGTNGSLVSNATLTSKQDALLATTQMQSAGKRSSKPSALQPNGSGEGGLPMRIIPGTLSMTTKGCPLLFYSQCFFVDFNTGTTADNVYGISSLTHTITPGKFESQLEFAAMDGYGKFEGAPTVLEYVQAEFEKATKEST